MEKTLERYVNIKIGGDYETLLNRGNNIDRFIVNSFGI